MLFHYRSTSPSMGSLRSISSSASSTIIRARLLGSCSTSRPASMSALEQVEKCPDSWVFVLGVSTVHNDLSVFVQFERHFGSGVGPECLADRLRHCDLPFRSHRGDFVDDRHLRHSSFVFYDTVRNFPYFVNWTWSIRRFIPASCRRAYSWSTCLSVAAISGVFVATIPLGVIRRFVRTITVRTQNVLRATRERFCKPLFFNADRLRRSIRRHANLDGVLVV